MTNTPSTSLERSAISADERNTLQDIINKLEGSSLKSGMDIYNDAVYQMIKGNNLSETTEIDLRTIKKGLNDGNSKYTREYIMAYLGINIPERMAPAESMIDLFAASQARKRKKMIKKPVDAVLAVLDPQRAEPVIVNPTRMRADQIPSTVIKSETPKKKKTPAKRTSKVIENKIPEEDSDNDNWPVAQKWVRITEVPQKVVARIPDIQKTPEEIEKHTALIAYLQEDFLSPYYIYFPSTTDISFDKYGCPIILHAYREKLSGMNQRMANIILDKVGDFIFKKVV